MEGFDGGFTGSEGVIREGEEADVECGDDCLFGARGKWVLGEGEGCLPGGGGAAVDVELCGGVAGEDFPDDGLEGGEVGEVHGGAGPTDPEWGGW